MLIATTLRTEYRKEPLGMDETVPRFSYLLAGEGKRQTARKVTVTDPSGSVQWDTGWVETDSTFQIEYAGKPLRPFTRYDWEVAVRDESGAAGESGRSFFETGFLGTPWRGRWTTHNPNMFLRNGMFVHDFELDRPVVSARLYATALGVYEASINGVPVAEDCLTPGWTDYFSRVQYQAYDVTSLLHTGGNAIAVELGNGWYCGLIARHWNNGEPTYGSHPAFRLELHLRFADGESRIIGSGRNFLHLHSGYAEAGEIRFSDIYQGEQFRQRRKTTQWKLYRGGNGSSPGGGSEFDDVTGCLYRPYSFPAAEEEHDEVEIVWQSGVPVRRIRTVAPVEIRRRPNGNYIVDFGENIAGRERFTLRRPVAGTTVMIRHGEMLNPDGSLYVENLRSAEAMTIYTSSEHESETYEPRFTFYGFRYLEISGWPGELAAADISAVVLSSELEQSGKFTCSENLLNRFYENVVRSRQANFIDVPTDCPQRDERFGWTGDAQIFAGAATYQVFAPAFYTKWLEDLNRCISSGGAWPWIAPDPYRKIFADRPGSTGWGDAGIVVPWVMFSRYADLRIAGRYLKNMDGWLDWQLRRASRPPLVPNSIFGDWLNCDVPVSETLISTAYFAGMLAWYLRMARLCGRTGRVAEREELLLQVKRAFADEFFTSEGQFKESSQTAALLTLHFDLVSGTRRSAVRDSLLRNLRERSACHLATGFLGTPLLLRVLSDLGETDLAYDLLLQTEDPSWLYPVTQGATSVWERWNSWTAEGGFGDIIMNSFNHYAFGAVTEWFFDTICGIRPDDSSADTAGFRHFFLAPQFGRKLESASAVFDSFSGRIESGWRRGENGEILWRYAVPAGTSAQIRIPDGFEAEDGKRVWNQAAGVHIVKLRPVRTPGDDSGGNGNESSAG